MRQNLVGDVNILQNRTEAVPKLLLAKIRKPAFAAKTRAVLVRVLALFYFRRYRAVIVRAHQQAGKRRFMVSVFWPIVAAENILDPIKELPADQGCLRSVMQLAIPVEQADVKWVLQDFFEVGPCD